MNKFNTSLKIFLLTFLIITVLISSLPTNTIANGSSETMENTTHIKNENELKNATKNASNNRPITIILDNDITLTSTLNIEHGDITLTSNKNSGFYKLISEASNTIIIGDGVLRLDGIIITHVDGTFGRGIGVSGNGQLFMYSGEISGNAATIPEIALSGGGVDNSGVFEMHGGVICNNTANSGGGVDNTGVFRMFGGEISGNVAGMGGGVFSIGTFNMSGGKIIGNTASYGGGVHCWLGVFDRQSGVISGNTASNEGDNVLEGSVGESSDTGQGWSPGHSGSEGFFGGNTGLTGGNNETFIDADESVGDEFDLRSGVIMWVGVVIVIVVISGVVLFFTSRK
ncbi:MAG: hypothetical protein FWH37_00270 [Candidatus Bathyarchaeota archaeon]|nr:hypothetical protein [Candidatus Termiticorpusculum sp.]